MKSLHNLPTCLDRSVAEYGDADNILFRRNDDPEPNITGPGTESIIAYQWSLTICPLDIIRTNAVKITSIKSQAS